MFPLKRPFTEALNSAMPVIRMGNFWEASTLVCANSSIRFSSTAWRSSAVCDGARCRIRLRGSKPETSCRNARTSSSNA